MNNIHPIFQRALAPFSPPAQMQRWIVEHVKPGVSRTPFEVMAPDRRSAVTANEGVCAPREYLMAWTPEEWNCKKERLDFYTGCGPAYRKALQEQQQREQNAGGFPR